MLDIAAALDRAPFEALTLYRTRSGWQASLSTDGTGWRVAVGATPSEAVAALFEPVPVWVPPLPPCPVALPALPY